MPVESVNLFEGTLEERLERIEKMLRGDFGADTIDPAAIPINAIQQMLQGSQQRIDAKKALDKGSVSATEIGVLPGARMEKVTNQAIASGLNAKIDYGRLVYDSGGRFQPTSLASLTNDEFTIWTSGIYLVTCAQYFFGDPAAGIDTDVYIELGPGGVYAANTTGYLSYSEQGTVAGGANPSHVVATVVSLKAGDKLRAKAGGINGLGNPIVLASDQNWGVVTPFNHFACQWICAGPS